MEVTLGVARREAGGGNTGGVARREGWWREHWGGS